MSDILTSVQRKPFEWIEIDQPLCVNAYGESPCEAILGTTGDNKCFNTRESCQDSANYNQSDSIVTLKFCHNQSGLPDDAYYFPYLQSVNISPGNINPGGGNSNISALGVRGTLTASFSDHPHTDRIVDPYLDDRDYIAYDRGTFWTKWKARNPYYMHSIVRHKSGFFDDDGNIDQDTLITRTFFMTGMTGPTSTGQLSISAKDILTLAANEKSKAPFASTGKLFSGINDTDISLTLSPSGVGDLDYPASGKVRIDKEIMSFTRVSDVMTIARGINNTVISAHDASDSVQLCLEYISQLPKDILEDLLVNYAEVDTQYLDLAQWAIESAEFLPRLYTAIIAEPTGVTDLISEMCEQMYFTTFWDDRTALLKLRSVRPAENESITDLNDDLNLLEESVQWVDLASELITEVWVYYAQKNPTEKINDIPNYGALDIIVDTEAETDNKHGTKKIKTVFARWLTSADGAAAVELGEKILTRYNKIPRKCTFKLDAKDGALWLADFISIENRNIVDFTGLPFPLAMQVVSANESQQGSTFTYTAIEYSGDTIDADPDTYSVDISTDLLNVNLRELFDSVYAVIPVSGDKIRFTIRNGVTIGGICSLDGNNLELIDIPSTSYSYNGNIRTETETIGVSALNEITFPYLSRHVITENKDYFTGINTPDEYNDPDTGSPSGFITGADIKERPAKNSLDTGVWPAGVELFLDIQEGAKVLGEGGSGGFHSLFNFLPVANINLLLNQARAGDGGHAFYIQTPIQINNLGVISGGGGGGEMAQYKGFYLMIIEGVIHAVRNIIVAGAGGSGFGNLYQPDTILVGSKSPSGEFWEFPNDIMDGAIASLGDKENSGYLGNIAAPLYDQNVFNVVPIGEFNMFSGSGGDLAENGGVMAITKSPDNAETNKASVPKDNNFGKQGLAGYAIKDGKELITWVQKGDVRGAEF